MCNITVLSIYLQRWVKAHRAEIRHLHAGTTNGLERQHEELKMYLRSHGDRTLAGVFEAIIFEYSPEQKKRYAYHYTGYDDISDYLFFSRHVTSISLNYTHTCIQQFFRCLYEDVLVLFYFLSTICLGIISMKYLILYREVL